MGFECMTSAIPVQCCRSGASSFYTRYMKRMMQSVYDKDHMSELWIENRSERDPHAVTNTSQLQRSLSLLFSPDLYRIHFTVILHLILLIFDIDSFFGVDTIRYTKRGIYVLYYLVNFTFLYIG